MLKSHLAYLKYVLKHKWYVLYYRKLFDVPLFYALVHDWTKFLPSEWTAYVNKFYGDDSIDESDFLYAWNYHQKRNKHHWNYWVVVNAACVLEIDGVDYSILPIPLKYIKEMVLDWFCAGLAINGTADLNAWFAKNKYRMEIHEETMEAVEKLISEIKLDGVGKELCEVEMGCIDD